MSRIERVKMRHMPMLRLGLGDSLRSIPAVVHACQFAGAAGRFSARSSCERNSASVPRISVARRQFSKSSRISSMSMVGAYVRIMFLAIQKVLIFRRRRRIRDQTPRQRRSVRRFHQNAQRELRRFLHRGICLLPQELLISAETRSDPTSGSQATLLPLARSPRDHLRASLRAKDRCCGAGPIRCRDIARAAVSAPVTRKSRIKTPQWLFRLPEIAGVCLPVVHLQVDVRRPSCCSTREAGPRSKCPEGWRADLPGGTMRSADSGRTQNRARAGWDRRFRQKFGDVCP